MVYHHRYSLVIITLIELTVEASIVGALSGEFPGSAFDGINLRTPESGCLAKRPKDKGDSRN